MGRLIDKQVLNEQIMNEVYTSIRNITKSLMEEVPDKVEARIIVQIAATAWSAIKPGRRAKAQSNTATFYLTKTDRYDRDVETFLQELEGEYPILTKHEPATRVTSYYISQTYYFPEYITFIFMLPQKGACTIVEETITESRPVTSHRVVCR
jgi:hypothetical protein